MEAMGSGPLAFISKISDSFHRFDKQTCRQSSYKPAEASLRTSGSDRSESGLYGIAPSDADGLRGELYSLTRLPLIHVIMGKGLIASATPNIGQQEKQLRVSGFDRLPAAGTRVTGLQHIRPLGQPVSDSRFSIHHSHLHGHSSSTPLHSLHLGHTSHQSRMTSSSSCEPGIKLISARISGIAVKTAIRNHLTSIPPFPFVHFGFLLFQRPGNQTA